MNILVLSMEYPPVGGGAGPLIHQINKYYMQAGHHVEAVTMAFGESSRENMDNIVIHRIGKSRKKNYISYPSEHVGFIFSARRFLRKFLKEKTFDVCHCHFILPTGIIARWVKTKFGIPYLITSHGSDVPGFNPDRFRLLHLFTPPLIRAIIQDSSFVVAPSRYLISLIEKTAPWHKTKHRHIPSVVDTEVYTPGEKKKIIMSSGRLLPRKGFQYLIEAVSHEDLDYELHICGDGPMIPRLQAMASASRTRIIFHGWLDNAGEEYITLLGRASIFCLMSLHENASNSLMEALSAGCAVITANVSGCPETVGDAGICIPPTDVNLLTQTLKELISNPDRLEQKMLASRAHALASFSRDSVGEQYMELLMSMIHG